VDAISRRIEKGKRLLFRSHLMTEMRPTFEQRKMNTHAVVHGLASKKGGDILSPKIIILRRERNFYINIGVTDE
jgi:hypothetical protein